MKIDRLLAITHILTDKKSVTAAYLAEQFNVSVRTIYRDIDILSSSGIPIYTTLGKGGGISLIEGYKIDKTILSDKEQQQIITALETIKVTNAENVDLSLTKLKNVFNKDTESWVDIDFSSWENTDSEKTIFSLIKRGILDKKILSFVYHNNQGENTLRDVEPVRLVFKWHNWYLYAYCRQKNDFRYFRLTRIEDIKIKDEIFDKKIGLTPQHSFQKSQKVVHVVLKVSKSKAFRIYDEFKGADIKEDCEYLIIDADIPANSDWIYSYLLGFQNDLEVLSPKYIRDNLKKISLEIYNKYI